MYDFLTHVLLVYDPQIIVQRDPTINALYGEQSRQTFVLVKTYITLHYAG